MASCSYGCTCHSPKCVYLIMNNVISVLLHGWKYFIIAHLLSNFCKSQFSLLKYVTSRRKFVTDASFVFPLLGQPTKRLKTELFSKPYKNCLLRDCCTQRLWMTQPHTSAIRMTRRMTMMTMTMMMVTMTMMSTLTVTMIIAIRLVRLSGVFTEEWCPSPISILPRVVHRTCHSVLVSSCSRLSSVDITTCSEWNT